MVLRGHRADLELEGVVAPILDPETFVVLLAALRARENEKTLLALHGRALAHAFGRVRLEVAVVAEDERVAVHVQVLPLAL